MNILYLLKQMKNFVMSNVGSSLLSVNCSVSSFRAGSLIGDLLVEVFAASQADADYLAQNVTNLVTATDNTALIVGDDSLSVSSLSLTGASTGRIPPGQSLLLGYSRLS